MTINEEKLQLLEEARRKVEELEQQKMKILKDVEQEIGLSEIYDREIWDFVINGLRFAKDTIRTALHTNEGENA